MFTKLQIKRLNRLTWNSKHMLLKGQVTGGIHKKLTFTARKICLLTSFLLFLFQVHWNIYSFKTVHFQFFESIFHVMHKIFFFFFLFYSNFFLQYTHTFLSLKLFLFILWQHFTYSPRPRLFLIHSVSL